VGLKEQNALLLARVNEDRKLRPGDVISHFACGKAIVIATWAGWPVVVTMLGGSVVSNGSLHDDDRIAGYRVLEVGRTDLFLYGGRSPRGYHHFILNNGRKPVYRAGCRIFEDARASSKHWSERRPECFDWERATQKRLWRDAARLGWTKPAPPKPARKSPSRTKRST
jgi:hypothetical protein